MKEPDNDVRNAIDQLEQSIAARHAETLEARREAGALRAALADLLKWADVPGRNWSANHVIRRARAALVRS